MGIPNTKKQYTLTVALFAVYLLALAWLVLFKLQFSVPVLEEGRVLNMIPFRGLFGPGGRYLFGEIRNNVIAFVPLGVYLCMLKGKWSFAEKTLAAGALSLAFELTQFVFVMGRADITDVIANTLGGVIGCGIYAVLRKLLKEKTYTVLNILAAACTIFVAALVIILMLSNRWIRIQ